MRRPLRAAAAVLLLAVVLPCARSQAQVAVSANLTSMYDDNSFAFYDRRADVYHQVFGGVTADISTDYSFFQPFWYGAAVLFRSYGERTYHQHTAGLYWQLQLNHRGDDWEEEEVEEEESSVEDEDTTAVDTTAEDTTAEDATAEGTTAEDATAAVVTPAAVEEGTPFLPADSLVSYLFLKPFVAGRFDRKAWAMYDFRSGALSAVLRRPLLLGVMSRLQYEGEFKQYPSFEQFTHIENDLTLVLNRRLLPSIELFCTAAYGFKSYTETSYDTTFLSGNSGKGKGKGSGKSKSSIIDALTTPSASQFIVGAGLAAGWGETTASLSFLRRLNPTNTARYVDRRVVGDESEDAFFDDRYGYQSEEIEGSAAFPLAAGFDAALELEFRRKVYPYTAQDLSGTTLAGDPQRVDLRTGLSLRVSRALLRRGDGSALLSAGAGLRVTRNQSNDMYHDYTINQGFLVVDISF